MVRFEVDEIQFEEFPLHVKKTTRIGEEFGLRSSENLGATEKINMQRD